MRRLDVAETPPCAARRESLRVTRDTDIRYRRVRLRYGDRILSEADNWYVPARLTNAMNRLLETTDLSFGRVTQDLRFRRRNLSAEIIWPPDLVIPGLPPAVLRHHAILALPNGTPFSEVAETYTEAILELRPS